METSYILLKESKLDHDTWNGYCHWSPKKQSLLISDGWGTAYPSIKLRRIDSKTLEEKASIKTGDTILALTHMEKKGLIACCSWHKRVLILNDEDLSKKAQIDGLGEGLFCLSFDESERYLAVGGKFTQTVKIIDTENWNVSARKRVSFANQMMKGIEENEILFLDGRAGSVFWYDCSKLKIAFKLKTPPFKSAVRIGDRILLGIGMNEPMSQIPKYVTHLPITAKYPHANLLDFIPDLCEEDIAQISSERSPLMEDRYWAPGTEVVGVISGIAEIDLVNHVMISKKIIHPISRNKLEWMQLSESGESVHLFTEGLIRTIGTNDFGIESEWNFPQDFSPLHILKDGKKCIAIMGHQRIDGKTRIGLLERPSM